MDRRDFVKKGLRVTTTLSLGLGMSTTLFNCSENENNNNKMPISKNPKIDRKKNDAEDLFKTSQRKKNNLEYADLIAIKGKGPDVMFDAGIKAYGGMKRFVKKGQTVVVKPNIGWNNTPELAGNTNPLLVKRIIEHCHEAGAKKIYVFDNSCDSWKNSYKNSGIERAAKEAGATVVPANQEKYYQEVLIPKAKILKKTKVHELILESDVFINVPILKHHRVTELTMAMKNLMGIVWDRRWYHANDTNLCIADFCLFKKPDLNIVDAYNVLKAYGPKGGSKEDVANMKYQLISTDMVAVDAAATRVFGKKLEEIKYLNLAAQMNIGNINLDQISIDKISL